MRWKTLSVSASFIFHALSTCHCSLAAEKNSSSGSTFCADSLLFRYPFHSYVTAVVRKRPRSFCQRCKWSVTAKHTHTYTIRLFIIHRTCAEMANTFTWQQPCNNQTALSVHHFGGYYETRKKGYSCSFRIPCDINVLSLLVSGE